MEKDEIIRKLKVITGANELLMIDQHGTSVCKNCMMQEAILELIKEADNE